MMTGMNTPIRTENRPGKGKPPAWSGPGRIGAAVLLLLVLAACAPSVTAPPVAPAAEAAGLETAQIIYHRMQLGRLENGTYTTNALVDVDLPRGLRWTVEAFPGESYELRVSDDTLPDIYWKVTPAGVQRIGPAGSNRNAY
jgi:hypothetical protein